jgi:hypothetical protein
MILTLENYASQLFFRGQVSDCAIRSARFFTSLLSVGKGEITCQCCIVPTAYPQCIASIHQSL